MKLRSIAERPYSTLPEGVALAPAPGGKKVSFDFDWRQDRPQDFIRLLPRTVHADQIGEFTVYYGFRFVTGAESAGVRQVAGRRQDLLQRKQAAPRLSAVNSLKDLPDDTLAAHGYEPDDTTEYPGFGPVVRGHNAALVKLLRGPLRTWAEANPELAAGLQAGTVRRPRSPAVYYRDATNSVERALATITTYQDLGTQSKSLRQQQTKTAAAYNKAANVLANLIQDQGEANRDVRRLLDVAVENFVNHTGGDYTCIILPESSNPTALMIARRIADYTGTVVGRPFHKPTEYGPGGLYFDMDEYTKATGKPAGDVNMGKGYPLPLSKIMARPSSFKMTNIRKDLRRFWKNTQMVDERWLAEHGTGRTLVVDDSISSGSTMLQLLEQAAAYADLTEGYALLKIGT